MNVERRVYRRTSVLLLAVIQIAASVLMARFIISLSACDVTARTTALGTSGSILGRR